MRPSKILIVFTLGVLFSNSVAARVWVVSQNNPVANDSNPGTSDYPFLTISKATLIAMPSDTVLVHAGIYRERVAPERGGEPGKYIVYLAAPGEKVILKGSEIWKNHWTVFSENVNIFSSPIDTITTGDFNPFLTRMFSPEKFFSLGEIFVNGRIYAEAESFEQLKQSPGSFYVQKDKKLIFIHFTYIGNYTIYNSTIEYAVRNRIFAPKKRGLGYIEVNGFIMEHCANQFPSSFWEKDGYPQAGALGCRSGNHWIIRNNSIRWAKSLGIDCGDEGPVDTDNNTFRPERNTVGYHLIENNEISDNGTCGIAGHCARNTIVRYNLIERNNRLANPWAESAGIKFHGLDSGIIEGNIVRDNDCSGIWLDWGWYGARITRNTVIGNSGQGIFLELGFGNCMVDNNIVAYTRMGDGIYTHDASGATIAHNLLYCNSHFGFYARIVTERTIPNEAGKKGICGTHDLKIFNNTFIDNYRGHICLPPDDGKRVFNNKSDYNLFVNGMQWQWEGLAFNSFTIGSNDKRISEDTLANILKNSLKRANFPPEKSPDPEIWKVQPMVNIDIWRIMTGNDLNSFTPEIHKGEVENGAVMKGASVLSPLDLFMNISNGESFNSFKCIPVKGIEKDFYNSPISTDFTIPGPFQVIKNGFNHLKCIPFR